MDDNTANISTLQELQVANGKFTTSGSQTYGYSDYRSLYFDSVNLNTANYSGLLGADGTISGYRYATFAWRFAAETYNGNIQFTLNAMVNPVPSTIQLFYRTEDASSPNPTTSAKLSSSWINGANDNGQGLIGSGNYFSQTNYSTTNLYYGWTSTPSAGRYIVSYPLTLPITDQLINLYCRIGIPMNSGFSFAYITATLS